MPLSLALLARRMPAPVASTTARRQRTLALAEWPLPLQAQAARPTPADDVPTCTLWHESSFDLLRGLEVAELDHWPAEEPA